MDQPLRTPNLNTLRMFDAAARHLNFRLAAEELNLTQGAVAQQVRHLEADLGLALFHRQARGLALTDAGRRYHGPVRQALELIEEATRKLRPESEHVTLSVPPSVAPKWLVPRLSGFASEHPDIELETLASETLANFQSDQVSLAIRQGEPPFGANLESDLLSPLGLRAVCSPALAKQLGAERPGEVEGIEDLLGEKLIQDSHRHWDRLLKDAGLAAQNPILQFNQTALAMDAAGHGQGIALAPYLLLEEELRRGTLVELWRDRRESNQGFYLVYPRLRRANPARQAVIDWVLSEARQKESFE